MKKIPEFTVPQTKEWNDMVLDMWFDKAWKVWLEQNLRGKSKKPPLGIIPKWLHDERRERELIAAIDRYQNAKVPVPKEWLAELRTLTPKS